MAALRSELQGLGHEHQPHLRGIVCDVTQPEQVAALAAQAKQLMGTVDVWVCNAGMAVLRGVPARLLVICSARVLGINQAAAGQGRCVDMHSRYGCLMCRMV
jgi:NAD(P)-dependent dehydrogenase (short-subunit alcohol dehydrogenase family)